MSKSSRGRRALRQRKASARWQNLTPINKKGQDPHQGRPLEDRDYAIFLPSRKGLQALSE